MAQPGSGASPNLNEPLPDGRSDDRGTPVLAYPERGLQVLLVDAGRLSDRGDDLAPVIRFTVLSAGDASQRQGERGAIERQELSFDVDIATCGSEASCSASVGCQDPSVV